jgi:hypothetical protein
VISRPPVLDERESPDALKDSSFSSFPSVPK